jgi:hypothetical protein
MQPSCQPFVRYRTIPAFIQIRSSVTITENAEFGPLTNLTTVSKLFERFVHAWLKSFIVSCPISCPLQSEYRSAHSTETALVKIMDDTLCKIMAQWYHWIYQPFVAKPPCNVSLHVSCPSNNSQTSIRQ